MDRDAPRLDARGRRAEGWLPELASYAFAAEDALLLFDPLNPPWDGDVVESGRDALRAALDESR